MGKDTASKEIDTILRDRLYQNLGNVTQALSAPVRLRILQILANRPCRVEVLSQMIDETVGNTSQHLQKMLAAGLISYKKNGVSRIYSLANDKVFDVWLALQNLAHDLVPQTQADEASICPDELCSTLPISEILKQVKRGEAILIDARTQEEFESTPVQNTINISSLKKLDKFSELPKSKSIFVFCRGRYCAMANPAVIKFRKKGYQAFRIKENSYQINKLRKI